MAIQAHLVELERTQESREELHEALVHLSTDDLQIVELKRRKLMVKDQIERLKHTAKKHSLASFTSIAVLPEERNRAHLGDVRVLGGRRKPCPLYPASSPTWSAIASEMSARRFYSEQIDQSVDAMVARPLIRKSCTPPAARSSAECPNSSDQAPSGSIASIAGSPDRIWPPAPGRRHNHRINHSTSGPNRAVPHVEGEVQPSRRLRTG